MLWRFIHLLHWAVLVFVLLGWLLPWTPLLWLHLIFVPALIIHWRTNADRCVLTELEHRYKNRNTPPVVTAEEMLDVQLQSNSEAAQEVGFIKQICGKLFGQEPSEELLRGIIYSSMILVGSLSAFQLFTSFRFLA